MLRATSEDGDQDRSLRECPSFGYVDEPRTKMLTFLRPIECCGQPAADGDGEPFRTTSRSFVRTRTVVIVPSTTATA